MADRCVICGAWKKSAGAIHHCPGPKVTVVPQLATNRREGGVGNRIGDGGTGGRGKGA